jgi:hypothetical protein
VLATLGVLAGGLLLASAPALAAAPEAPLTEAPSALTGTTATFNGELNPGASTENVKYHFAYSPGAGCTESGLVAPESPAEAEGGHTKVSEPVTNLEGSADYTVCLIAANPAEEAESTQGTSVKFKTAAVKPLVVAQSASDVTPFDATLEGQVDPENQETTYHLEYATSEALLGTPSATTLAYGIAGPGVSAVQSVGPADLGGVLTPATTYHYRVVAKNATGETRGTVAQPVASFTTDALEKPAIEAGSEKLGAITQMSATLEAQVNPNYQETSYVFEYAANAALTENVVSIPGSEDLSGFGDQPARAPITGLQIGRTYYFRVIATNAAGTAEGAVQSFTRELPRVNDTPPVVSEVGQHTVRITPTIDPEIEAPLETAYYITYGPTEAYGSASSQASAGSGLVDETAGSLLLYGLMPGTTYQYAVVASNAIGTSTGPDHEFTTAAAEPLTTPPAVGAESSQFSNEDSAVIIGEMNPEGLETSYEVQYGTSTAYGSHAPVSPVEIGPFTSMQGTITALDELAPGTTYHYRLVASSSAGTSYGQDGTFTTSGARSTTAFTPFTIAAVPLIDVTTDALPAEERQTSTTKPLTKAQRLAAALKVCRRDRKKAKRSRCEKQARARYAPAPRRKS